MPGLVVAANGPVSYSREQIKEMHDQHLIREDMYTDCSYAVAVPIYSPIKESKQRLMAVWEVLLLDHKHGSTPRGTKEKARAHTAPFSTTTVTAEIADHIRSLLELASTYTQPYLLQCDVPNRRLGSVTNIGHTLAISPTLVRLPHAMGTHVMLQLCLYHGEMMLTRPICMRLQQSQTLAHEYQPFTRPDQSFKFDCTVQSLPRAAHLECLVLKSGGSRGQTNIHPANLHATRSSFIAMTKCFIFSCDHDLRSGMITLALRPTQMSLPVEIDTCLLPTDFPTQRSASSSLHGTNIIYHRDRCMLVPTHTHTHIYICIYIYILPSATRERRYLWLFGRRISLIWLADGLP
jgi:hypothetical protein